MGKCIFCSIVQGDLPSTKIYEDDRVLAFMDVGPIVAGHALVIPKEHHETIEQIPSDLLAQVIRTAQQVARAQLRGLDADGVNIHQANGSVAGQVVPHIHFHIIPRFRGDGHSWNWAAREYDDPNEAEQLASKISGAMEPL